ncbi:unnamed protein product [Citrullus colocynthis]|uniref:Uncharacterized protein n=1 Tax=Citrullus colocynthis TaxID=252529 RepID=A0ABP0YJY9_9ROSI
MEESSSSRNSEEVLDAAQQLMQLSNDDNNSSNVAVVVSTKNNKNKNKKKMKKDHGGGGEEEVDQKRCQIESSVWLKIEEIFGKDDEKDCCDHHSIISRPKKRRFRSIESIYMNTKPININGRFSANTIVGCWTR